METVVSGLDGLDRRLFLLLNGLHATWLDGAMWAFSQLGVMWVPLYLVLIWLLYQRLGWRRLGLLLFLIGLTITITDQIASGLLKPLVARPRPTHQPALSGLVHTVYGYTGGEFGFVSSHAANSVGVAVVLMTALRSERFRWLAPMVLTVAALGSYSRIYLGVHYPGDILCGALLGGLVAIPMGLLYRRLIRSGRLVSVDAGAEPSRSEQHQRLS